MRCVERHQLRHGHHRLTFVVVIRNSCSWLLAVVRVAIRGARNIGRVTWDASWQCLVMCRRDGHFWRRLRGELFCFRNCRIVGRWRQYDVVIHRRHNSRMSHIASAALYTRVALLHEYGHRTKWCSPTDSERFGTRRRQRVVVEDCSVTPIWPRVVDLLHRSAGGVLLLSLRSWSIHRLLGRPGRRFQLWSGKWPRVRSTWHRSAWWAGVSSGSLAMWPKTEFRRRVMMRCDDAHDICKYDGFLNIANV